MRYSDAPGAIAFLCEAFGFAQHLVVEDGQGGIAHAQLTHGNGMIMLGSAREDEFGRIQQPLGNPTDTVSQSAYVIVSDIDNHYAKAVKAGATILMELQAVEHGGKFYCCRDPEGQVWNFGDYSPWESDS